MKPADGLSKTPLWREEFSVHTAEDKYVLRRQFTKYMVLTSFGMLAGNIWIWARSLFAGSRPALPQVSVASASEIPVGGVKLFNYPGDSDPCIMVRKANGELVAFSQKCTHLSCAVYYSKTDNRLECPCHEGYFSIDDGRVLQGPPPRPLPRIQIALQGDQVIATGIEMHGEGE
jgi:Rieske Fe-S protein